MTRVRLRSAYYIIFDVAEGDIPTDAILARLINFPIDSHALAVAVIDNIMPPNMIVILGNEPSDGSDLSNASDTSRSRVNHQGDPPAGVVDADNNCPNAVIRDNR
jgi:hypothetical protein